MIPLIAILYGCYSISSQVVKGYQTSTIGYGLVIALPMLLCAGVVLFKAVKNRKQEVRTEKKHSLRPLGLLGGMIVFIALLPILGYFLDIFLYLIILMWFFQVRRWSKLVAVALGTTLVIHVIFVLWLQLPLPQGLITGL